jgi:NTE family protein
VIGHGITARKMERGGPHLTLRPNTGPFRLFDFFRASAILRAAEPVKAELRAALSAVL